MKFLAFTRTCKKNPKPFNSSDQTMPPDVTPFKYKEFELNSFSSAQLRAFNEVTE